MNTRFISFTASAMTVVLACMPIFSAFGIATAGATGSGVVPAVMNLSAVAKDTTTITLSWDTPNFTDAVQFEVRYSTSAITDSNVGSATIFDNTLTPIAGISQTLDVTGLTPSTLYYFSVKMKDSHGACSAKKYTSATTQAVVVPPPPVVVPPVMNLVATSKGTTVIGLTWDTPSFADMASFDIRYSTSVITDANVSSATQVTGAPTPISGTSQAVDATGLTPSTKYYFAIRVVGSTGTISVTKFANATTDAVVVPPTVVPAVTNLAAVAKSTTVITLNWDTPVFTNATSFVVRYSAAPITDANLGSATAFTNSLTPISNVSQTLDVTGLTPTTLYYFSVQLKNSDNVLSAAKFTSATTLTPGTSPIVVPPVMNFTGTPTQTTLNLTWDTPVFAGLSAFDLRCSTSAITNSNFNSITAIAGLPAPVSGTSQGMSVTGLTPSTAYYCAILESHTSGATSTIKYVSLTTSASGGGGGGGGSIVVPPVMNFVATPSCTYTDVTWDTPTYADLARFELRYSTGPINVSNFSSATSVSALPAPISGTKQTMHVTGLTASTMHYFAIRIFNASNLSSVLAFSQSTTLPASSCATGGGGNGGGAGTGAGGSTSWSTIGGGSVITTTTIPKPTIIINNGATTTDSALVTLSIGATGYSEMMLSNTNDFANAKWETTASSTRWILIPSNGEKFVYGRFRNATGTVGEAFDSIYLSFPLRTTIITQVAVPVTVAPGVVHMEITPNVLDVSEGKKISVVLTAIPEDTAYNAHVILAYPTEALTLEKVEYGNGWVPEYGDYENVDDLVRGVLVKTARYPGGFNEPKHFATVTFVSKGIGGGAITIVTEDTGPNLLTKTSIVSDIMQSRAAKAIGSQQFASILTLTGFNHVSDIIALFSILVILYIGYIAVRDRYRHGRVFFHTGFKK